MICYIGFLFLILLMVCYSGQQLCKKSTSLGWYNQLVPELKGD